MSKKKEKYVPLVGLTGVGEDYNIYTLSVTEWIIGFAIGAAAGFFAAHVMFEILIVSAVTGVIVGFIAVPIYRNYLQTKRKKEILNQFRDLLDSLSTSFSAGQNTLRAFSGAGKDLELTYGEKVPMVKEVKIVVSALYNTDFVIEDLLKDMAKRCGIDDIDSFAEIFATCKRLGGDLKRIVTESRDIISEKIEIEMEIQTTLAANKNAINIMTTMPFVIVWMMKTLGNEAITANTGTNVIVKIIAIIIFAVAYIIGRKITDIKV